MILDFSKCNYRKIGLNIPIIDTHMHHGILPQSVYAPIYDIPVLLKFMDEFNIKVGLCTHTLMFISYKQGYNELLKLMKETQYRVLGYLVFNPNFLEASQKHVVENISARGIVGIKIHPALHQCSINDKKYQWLWEFCSENDVKIQCHTWSPTTGNIRQRYSDPLMFEDVTKKFPKLKVILAHAGGKPSHMLKVLEMMKKHENLYVDFAGDTFFPGIIESFVEKIGSKRILFGSDLPMIDPRMHIGRFIFSNLKEAELIDIFFNNANTLFSLNLKVQTNAPSLRPRIQAILNK